MTSPEQELPDLGVTFTMLVQLNLDSYTFVRIHPDKSFEETVIQPEAKMVNRGFQEKGE